MNPAIFISSVTREFSTTRQRVANILTRLGFEPVWEDILGSEPGDIRPILQRKMDTCAGLIQLVGQAYGSEPPTEDAEFGRVSYTQFEFCYMQKLGRKTWLIFPGDACTRDATADKLDQPRDPAHPNPNGFQAERRALQNAYRQKLRASEHLYHEPKNDAELELVVERLRDDLGELRQIAERWQQNVTNSLGRIEEAQRITKERIEAQLRETSAKRLAEDLAAAEQAKGWEQREHQREVAQQAHASRLVRLSDLANSFAELENKPNASAVTREVSRILQEEGVEAALAYVDRQRPGVLDRVRARQESLREQNRAELSPLLQAATLQAVKGDVETALAQYREVLSLEPDWPKALVATIWFLHNQTDHARIHGTLNDALRFSDEVMKLARHRAKWQPTDQPSLRALAAALCARGDVLLVRCLPGDNEQALTFFQTSLQLCEQLLITHPNSAEATRDVSINVERLGDFFSDRGLPGDTNQALVYFQRSLQLREQLLKANPKSAEAARDVAACLERLGGSLANRGLPGDFEQAFAYFQRDLEISEQLLKANPSSAEARRDVSVALNKLGDFLSKRGLPGDAEQAFKCYQRDLETNEQRFKETPHSAQAARDVSVSLERMGAFLTRRNSPGDADQAFAHFQRSFQIRIELQAANPESAETAHDLIMALEQMAKATQSRPAPDAPQRALALQKQALELARQRQKRYPKSASVAQTTAACLFLATQRARAAGEQALADQYRTECHTLLHELVTAGIPLNAPMLKLYQELDATKGTPPPAPDRAESSHPLTR